MRSYQEVGFCQLHCQSQPFFAIDSISVVFSGTIVVVCGLIHFLSEDSIKKCCCAQNLGVITVVGGSVTYAITIGLGRCNAFAEKLDNKRWNSCDRRLSATQYTMDNSCILLCNALGLTV